MGWLADPLFLGDYPKAMRDTQKGLPKFTSEQKALVMGSVDFLSLNFYTAHFVKAPPAGAPKTQVRAGGWGGCGRLAAGRAGGGGARGVREAAWGAGRRGG